MWAIKNGTEHYYKGYNLRHFASDWPCELCNCNMLKNDWPHNFHNFATKALWKETVFNARTWRVGEILHPLFQLIGVGVQCIDPDELHIIHLGTSMVLLGSVLWLLVYKVLKDTAAANMRLIWKLVQERYKDLQSTTQYSSLTLSSFHDPDRYDKNYPKLKGRGCEVKDLVAPVLWIWDKFMSKRSGYHKLIRSVLAHQLDIQTILTTHAPLAFLPKNAAHDLTVSIDLFLKKYTILAQQADTKKELLWPVTVKHHYLWHLGQKAIFLNPRKANCAIDEDFVKWSKEIVASCIHAVATHRLPDKFIEKYRWGLHTLNTYGPP